MTRKTFATRMLRADNKLDDISNALGHARQETAEVYLERDEDKMRALPSGIWRCFIMTYILRAVWHIISKDLYSKTS